MSEAQVDDVPSDSVQNTTSINDRNSSIIQQTNPTQQRASHSRQLSFVQQLTQNVHSDIIYEKSRNSIIASQHHLQHIQTTNNHNTLDTLNANTRCNSIPLSQSTPTNTNNSNIIPITPTADDDDYAMTKIDYAMTQKGSKHKTYAFNISTVSSVHSIDFNVINNNNASVSKIYISLYYMLRFLSVIITLFLAIITINYAIGQIYTLTAENFFCQDFTEEEVREYNYKHQIGDGGSQDKCRKIHRPEIDVTSLTKETLFTVVLETNWLNNTACIAFSILAFALSMIGIWHLYLCCYDAYYHFIKGSALKNPRIISAKFKINRKIKPMKKVRGCTKWILWYKRLTLWVFKHYYPDSKWKIVSMIFSETMEMVTQIWALLIYGGVQSVSFSFVLANEPKFVKSFATIIGLNAIFAGLLWILYVIKFREIKCCNIDLNELFRGTSFQSIIFLIDMSFDFVYTIFPFTLYSGDDGLLLFNKKALATLSAENGILFFAAFVAMVLLFKKCYNMLSNFNPVTIEKRANKIIAQHIDLTPFIELEYQSMDKNTNKDDSNNNIEQSMHETNEYLKWRKKQIYRRCSIALIGLTFLISGFTIIFTVRTYMNTAWNMCSNPSDELLVKHPELNYWSNNGCKVKLIPFVTITDETTPCDCRKFKEYFSKKHYDSFNFTNFHIYSILKNWKMLTDVDMRYFDDLYAISAQSNGSNEYQEKFALNLTMEYFPAKRMRSIWFLRINIIDIDYDGLTSLSNLEVLHLGDSKFTHFDWSQIGKLKQLKLLSFIESVSLTGHITEDICDLNELLYLDLQLTRIQSIPDCIGTDLTQLTSISLRGMSELEYITPNIFGLPNLIMVTAFWSKINVSSIPINDEWRKHKLKSVFLQTTSNADSGAVCSNLDLLNDKQIEFINHYKTCYQPCPNEGGINQKCSAYNFGDGKCTEDCCNYDNGDCFQLCPCHFTLWFNDKCDLECNSTLCAYDFGSCINIDNNDEYLNNNNNDTECIINSGCLEEWQMDDWCDANCQQLKGNEKCGDIYDCDIQHQCDELSNCYDGWLYIINHVANIQEPKELMDEEELCIFWSYIQLFSSDYNNCTHAWPYIDINNDGYISFWEGLQFTAPFFGITQQKAHQLNCSECLENPTLYY